MEKNTIARDFELEYLKEDNDSVLLSEIAEQTATGIDQDWENERTIYTFRDGSKLAVSGTELEEL